jgi:leader peptidase (prepilin peptidase) / N-methyltransferase
MSTPLRLAIAAAAALAASPVLASWTVTLAADQRRQWWRPRRVSAGRWATVAVVATVFACLGARGVPAAAWWLLAVTGAVLAIVDSETCRLPRRLVGPLAAAELVVLALTALVADQPQRLLRAVLAAAAVAGGYLLLVVAAPSLMGLGDVYLAGITAGLLGWSGWNHLLAGQVLLWLLGPIGLAAAALARPAERGWKMHVPMGPALIGSALLACWL